MTLVELTKEIQKKVGVVPDGLAGPMTMQAIYDALFDVKSEKQVPEEVDARSKSNIATLHPKVRPLAERLIFEARRNNIDAKVISGTRSFDEQAALYAQGRTAPGPIVTAAPPGFSNHNFGLSFDCGIWKNGSYIESGKEYQELGKLGKLLGLDWGGDWKMFVDEPHFECKPTWALNLPSSQFFAELRRRKEANIDAFA